ncbi:MAG TPA: tetratricopeptide repeat protein [Fulvivirga sp.]|nr:tetratricopeptide repeat protein [Fulvivirga sp.]
MTKLILIFASLVSLTCYGQTNDELVEKTRELANSGKIERALELIDEGIKNDSLNENYYSAKAEYISRNGNYKEAFELLDKALSINEKNAYVHYVLSIFYNRVAYFDDAIKSSTTAISLLSKSDPLLPFALLYRGQAYTYKQDYENALEEFGKVIELDSKNISGIVNYAVTLGELGRDEEAIPYFYKLIDIDSTLMVAYMNLGYTLTEVEQYSEAVKMNQKTYGLCTDDKCRAVALNNLGLAQAKLGRTTEGVDNIKKSLEMYPKNSYAYRNLAFIYIDLQDYEKACDNIDNAIELKFPAERLQDLIELYCK